MDQEVDYVKVKEAMKKGFEAELGIEFTEDGLNEEEKKLAENLERNKYSTNKWNCVR